MLNSEDFKELDEEQQNELKQLIEQFKKQEDKN